MTNALKTVRTRKGHTSTPQTQKISEDQVKNNAGGYVYAVDGLDRVKRFLILGSDTNFYESGRSLSRANAENIIKVIEASPEGHKAVVDAIVEVSTQGRAPKQDPALFALAIATAYGEVEGRRYAVSKLNEVARTGTTLFLFMEYVEQFRGWGRALRNALANWYSDKSTDELAYQAVKYRNRGTKNHRKALIVGHPKGLDEDLSKWILGYEFDIDKAPAIVRGFEKASKASIQELPGLIREFGLTWEMIPTEHLNNVKVWEALLDGNVPLGALVRQLPRLTQIGIIKPLSKHSKAIAARLTDAKAIRKSRLHPLNLLVAQETYASGRSLRGSGTWSPDSNIVAALEKAFYLAYGNVESTGKNMLMALDVSGSMGWTNCAGAPITAAKAVAALSLVFANTEENSYIVGFADSVVDLGINKADTLNSAMNKAAQRNFGSTNAAAAIEYATKNGLDVDVFLVMTDNDTWHGKTHVSEALETYRRKTGNQNVKLIVLATSASGFSIADPKDPMRQLDIAGFDTAAPQIVSEFARGL
jgi:60 kDa SS-A/Ro ribonucleoprotein